MGMGRRPWRGRRVGGGLVTSECTRSVVIRLHPCTRGGWSLLSRASSTERRSLFLSAASRAASSSQPAPNSETPTTLKASSRSEKSQNAGPHELRHAGRGRPSLTPRPATKAIPPPCVSPRQATSHAPETRPSHSLSSRLSGVIDTGSYLTKLEFQVKRESRAHVIFCTDGWRGLMTTTAWS